jgi:hypothetical protein
MENMLQSVRTQTEALFLTPITTAKQVIVVFVVALLLILTPQNPAIDWDLNTRGFWSDFPNVYDNPDRVYPPWGLILMIPYYLMRPEGARFFSGVVIGLLVMHRGWSLSRFLSIVLSPYFLWTLAKSSMDVFVLVLPIVLWERAAGRRWQSFGWGLALALSLLKPQCTLFILPYWLWTRRKQWRALAGPVAILACLVVPVSLVGTPPLIVQWIENLRHPSAQNALYWSINNVSLTAEFSFIGAVAILFCLSLILALLAHSQIMRWTNDHTLSCLLFASMFLSPYTSQQSVSSALAFVPSWAAVAVQVVGLAGGALFLDFPERIPRLALFLALVSLILFNWSAGRRRETETTM